MINSVSGLIGYKVLVFVFCVACFPGAFSLAAANERGEGMK
jgi:hypothetical protein